MFKRIETAIPGCYEIVFRKLEDNRGSFIKTFHEDLFRELNISMHIGEEFFSTSGHGVFRGMHFQVPPKAIQKIVTCVSGHVTDYLVDLRKGSPMFGKHLTFELKSSEPRALFVCEGIAHGFYVRSDEAIMHYRSSGVFDAPTDAGISYRSFDFAADIDNPVISEKDKNLPLFKDFDNPFIF